MKKLIVPVDFSEESIVAIENAIEFANKVGLHICMVHVKKKKSYYFGFSLSEAEKIPNQVFESHFNQLKEAYAKKYKAGGTFDFKLKHGNIAVEILNETRENNVYAIFTGLQGNTSWRDYLVGSNAYNILAGARIPVFTTRKDMGVRNFGNILMPIDNSMGTRIKVPVVSDLASHLKIPVTVMALSDTGFEEVNNRVYFYAKQAVEYLKSNNVQTTIIEKFNTNIPHSIIETAKDLKSEMIAIMSDLTDDPLGYILTSSVKYILSHADCPLMCIPINI